MKHLAIVLALLAPASPLLAQREHGGAGRDGGSRAANDQRRSDMLKQNNDPRFVPFRTTLSTELGKSVAEMAAEYDRTVKQGIRFEPYQFVAIHRAAKRINVKPTVLAAKTWSPPTGSGAKIAAAQASTPSPEEFRDQLAGTLIQLTKMSQDDAKESVNKSLDRLSPTNPKE